MNKLYSLRKVFCTKVHTNLVNYNFLPNEKIGILTLNNPEKRNSLSEKLLRGMIENLNQIEVDYTSGNAAAKVLIINANGPVFCSGHDLKELSSTSKEKQAEIFKLCSEMMLIMKSISPIVVGEVHGIAAAAGAQLVANCDLVVASSKSFFSTPGVKFGLFCTTPGVEVGRVISKKRAMQMLVSGESIDAQTALDWGLINHIADVGKSNNHEEERKELRDETLKFIKSILGHSSKVLSYGKRTFYEQIEFNSNKKAYEYAEKCMVENLGFEDTKEGISAFIQKRKPNFK